jgi:abhydrolase domain-containing protein 13
VHPPSKVTVSAPDPSQTATFCQLVLALPVLSTLDLSRPRTLSDISTYLLVVHQSRINHELIIIFAVHDCMAASSGVGVLRVGRAREQLALLQAKVRKPIQPCKTMLTTRCSDLIYPRNVPENARTAVPKPPDFQIDDFEELSLRTPDEENLHAFLLRPTDKRERQNVTVIMFHGNAGNIGHRLPIAKVLTADLGYNVFFVEYRGYGFSSGDPNEKGLNIDAQTALDHIRGREDLRDSKIVIYGQSLGGAVAINLVNRNQKQGDIAALILENTFLSIRSLIPRFVHQLVYQWLSNSSSILPPAKYLAMLCHQIWPSNEVLPRIRDIPVLFLSGLRDEIVP